MNARRLVVEEGGVVYDSDAYDDELPYRTTVDGKPHLVVRYSLVHNDGKFARGGVVTGEQFFAFLKDGFDMRWAEATQPRMTSVGLRMRLIGHPAHAAGLARFLDYFQRREAVWITRRLDIPRHWQATHPYAG